MRFQGCARLGIPLPWVKDGCPIWIPAGLLVVAGLVMHFLWANWRPEYKNRELVANTALHYLGVLNTQVNDKAPRAKDDDYVLLLGFFLLLESYSDTEAVGGWGPDAFGAEILE